MKHYDIVQGTDEWFTIKLGKVSASHINDVMATVKSGEAVTRRNYRAKLIAEKLTGAWEVSFQSADMARGILVEPQARLAYQFAENVEVEQVGWVDHPHIDNAGASPDTFVNTEGLAEIKCPKTATHLDYIMYGMKNLKYKLQMQFQMACTGRKWCDFVSYDPKLPVHLQLFVKRFERDDELILEIETAVSQFIFDMDEVLNKVLSKGARG